MDSRFAITARHLSKQFTMFPSPRHRLANALGIGNSTAWPVVRALDDISFDVAKGSSVGIVGRNGSGKSTLLQVICGIVPPTAGTIEVDGRIATILDLGSGFAPELSGRENVVL